MHASLNTDKGAVEQTFKKSLIKTMDLPVGCIVGSVMLIDVKKYDTFVLDGERHRCKLYQSLSKGSHRGD